MAEFGKHEITGNTAAFDNWYIRSFENACNHQRFLLALLQCFGIHKGSIDIAGTVSAEHDQQEQRFHIRDNFVRDRGWSLVERLTIIII